jgi:hypothetical protein
MWSISVCKNDVKVTVACAKELFKSQAYEDELWYDLDDVADKGKLMFNSDHMEHMDYLASHDKMVKILCKHKVKGDICFGSLDGDNAGSFWGYRFDGKGKVKDLVGSVEFKENK